MTEIRLAQSGMGMTDGTIIAWHKHVGDQVTAGDPLCDIEAAKTTIEYESPVTGVLTKILVQVDENVPVNTLLAEIDENGGAQADGGASPSAAAETPAVVGASSSDPAKATPLARRVAKQQGVDLSAVKGSGPNGKVRRNDVVNAASGSNETKLEIVQIEPRARKAARDLKVDLTAIKGSGPSGRIIAEDVIAFRKANDDAPKPTAAAKAPAAPASEAGSGFKDVTHSMMRRTIANRLTESKQTVPHFYVKASCRIDELLTLRVQVNKTSDIKISINDFIIRAIALALIDTPEANVTWGEKTMRKYDFVDIAVAVATPRGLVTPIIRTADEKRVDEIAKEVKELAARGRQGKLKPEEYQGGVTTISNLGMFGVEEFFGIINPPQSTIFAIGAGEKRMLIIDDEPTVSTMMNVTMSVDHRAVDGATAAELMAAFKAYINNPMRILL
jgi:pyruvate dehydrogenase E2 component (dihydrolipoyllysine-residue acetyltransferase)